MLFLRRFGGGGERKIDKYRSGGIGNDLEGEVVSRERLDFGKNPEPGAFGVYAVTVVQDKQHPRAGLGWGEQEDPQPE
ncbi:hypothetical protein NKR23_g2119 [Pleurostoma richardsiae]|uniref:Uncharacterized protein n=1 Tax=Pleurostoma richardsiae TaxID=41990 RepID=A0AA38S3P8_9PEZI|nr:hypothetical protein NKR23_g2119 [Pleurostoma richardsiae]